MVLLQVAQVSIPLHKFVRPPCWSVILHRHYCIITVTVITRSLHDTHEMNAYRAGPVCMSVCPHDSTREQLDGFG
jgi:hypothetical protein